MKITPLHTAYFKARAAEKTTHIIGVIANIGCIIFTILMIIAATFQIVLPHNGYEAYSLVGESMQPTHYAGGLVICDTHVNISDLDTGEIICFRSPDGDTICHRVNATAIDSSHVETKGDHNNTSEGYSTTNDNLIGRVIAYIPMVGFIMNYSVAGSALLTCIFAMMSLLTYLLHGYAEADRQTLQPTWDRFVANQELKRRAQEVMAAQ
jgi:signal peptidase I